MTNPYRNSRNHVPVFPRLAAGTFSLDRAPGPLLAMVIALSVALAALTANRLIEVERDLQPALTDERRMGAALEATRILLRDGRLGAVESRIARADSQAQRFHGIATASRPGAEQRAQLLAYDASFGEYYVAARRAAAGLSMSQDADGSSAEEAALGYATLRQSVNAGIAARERAIDAARPSTVPIELAGWLSLMLLSIAALMRRASRREPTEWPVAAVARHEPYVPVPAGDGPPTLRLNDSVERLARKRLAASVASARVAKRNNERQIELARSWNIPMLTIVPSAQPLAEMDVYEDESADAGHHAMGRTLTMV